MEDENDRTVKGALIGECSTWLSIVSKLFGTRMGTLLGPHDLTVGQFSILHHIVRPQIEGGSRVSEIAAAVEVEQPAVTKTLAKFQSMGLVEITGHPRDKRAKVVVGTPAAGALLGTIYQDIGPDLGRVFGALDGEDAQELARLLKQLGQWLDANRLGK